MKKSSVPSKSIRHGKLNDSSKGLKLKRLNLVGHSIAADEISRFALTYPDCVSKLVYLEAAYDCVEAQRLESKYQNSTIVV